MEEHIWFYGLLKGLDAAAVKREIEQMVEDTGLQRKRHDRSVNLSGTTSSSSSSCTCASTVMSIYVYMYMLLPSRVYLLDDSLVSTSPVTCTCIYMCLMSHVLSSCI